MGATEAQERAYLKQWRQRRLAEERRECRERALKDKIRYCLIT